MSAGEWKRRSGGPPHVHDFVVPPHPRHCCLARHNAPVMRDATCDATGLALPSWPLSGGSASLVLLLLQLLLLLLLLLLLPPPPPPTLPLPLPLRRDTPAKQLIDQRAAILVLGDCHARVLLRSGISRLLGRPAILGRCGYAGQVAREGGTNGTAATHTHSERWTTVAPHRPELTDLRPGDRPPKRLPWLPWLDHDETPRVVVARPHRASSFRALSDGTPPVRIPPRATGSPSTSITCHIRKV